MVKIWESGITSKVAPRYSRIRRANSRLRISSCCSMLTSCVRLDDSCQITSTISISSCLPRTRDQPRLRVICSRSSGNWRTVSRVVMIWSALARATIRAATFTASPNRSLLLDQNGPVLQADLDGDVEFQQGILLDHRVHLTGGLQGPCRVRKAAHDLIADGLDHRTVELGGPGLEQTREPGSRSVAPANHHVLRTGACCRRYRRTARLPIPAGVLPSGGSPAADICLGNFMLIFRVLRRPERQVPISPSS
jgi:hypothetical protein